MNEEEARRATWRYERASERSTRQERELGEISAWKTIPGILSRAPSPLEIPGFLGDATDETDNYRFGTGLRGTARKTAQRARDVIIQTARSVPLCHSDHSRPRFLPSFLRPLAASRARIEAARRDPGGRVSKSHLARESLPSLFPGSFSRLALSPPSRPAPLHLFIFSLDRRGQSVFWSPSNLRVTSGKKTYSWILLQVPSISARPRPSSFASSSGDSDFSFSRTRVAPTHWRMNR